MSDLKISRELALPLDLAGETIAILAKRGAGKTNTATVLVEELVAANVQTVIVDPVGAWWGIRSSAAGERGAGLAIPIIGGQHGDVELEQTAGQLIADVVVGSGQSMLLDLSDFPSKGAVNRFVTDFAERLYRRKARASSLLHLVLEEADEFAPQRGQADTARMRGAIEQIVRRGRSRGLGVTLITQRSAVLNKDVLTQAAAEDGQGRGRDPERGGAWLHGRRPSPAAARRRAAPAARRVAALRRRARPDLDRRAGRGVSGFGYKCEHCPTRVPMTRPEFRTARRVLCDPCAAQLERVSVERKLRQFSADRSRRAVAA